MKEGSHHTKESIEKMREARKKQISPMLDKHHTKEAKEKMRIAHLNKPAWNKGLTFEQDNRIGKPWLGKHRSEEIREKLRLSHLGKHLTREIKEKIGNGNKGKTITKEQLKNMLRRHIPSSLEEKFQSIVDKYNLPYKYVGDGSFKIDKYNPDFINTNSEKIAIEVYTKYFKKRNNNNIEDWKEKRSKIFAKYGWSIFFFDETQVNEGYVLEKLEI